VNSELNLQVPYNSGKLSSSVQLCGVTLVQVGYFWTGLIFFEQS
jgi:hypothetical protein